MSHSFGRFVGVRVGVARCWNKLALRKKLRNLNAKSQKPSVTYALPHRKISPGKTTVLSWRQGPLMINHTQIDKGKTEIQFVKSRVSRGQNNDHDRPARNRTLVRWQSAPAGRWLLR